MRCHSVDAPIDDLLSAIREELQPLPWALIRGRVGFGLSGRSVGDEETKSKIDFAPPKDTKLQAKRVPFQLSLCKRQLVR